MSRMSITLEPDRHKALKEAAARTGKSIAQLVDDALVAYGIKTRVDAREWVRRAVSAE